MKISHLLCEIWGFQGSAAENSGLPGHDTVTRWVVPGILKDCSPFILQDQALQAVQEFLDCLTPKLKGLHSSKMSETTHQMTVSHPKSFES
jgi:hypothetical protein